MNHSCNGTCNGMFSISDTRHLVLISVSYMHFGGYEVASQWVHGSLNRAWNYSHTSGVRSATRQVSATLAYTISVEMYFGVCQQFALI